MKQDLSPLSSKEELTSFFDSDIIVTHTDTEEECIMFVPYSRYYNYDTDYERQRAHKQKIAYLKTLLDKKRNGIPLTEEELQFAMLPLQRAGIVDEHGKLTEHYRGDA